MKPLAPADNKFLWWRIRPITARRLANFRAHRRGYWSMWVFLFLFVFTLFAEFIANDRPLVIWYDGGLYAPVLKDYPEKTFGGDLPGNTDYSDKFIQDEINKKGWMLWPLIPYSYNASVKGLTKPAPTGPTWQNWLGTDNQARDVLARVIYGFRISVLFGLTLTILSSIIGILFSGSLLIETMFSLEGLGLLGFEAALGRDYPVLFGALYVFSLIGLLTHLITDLTYMLVDPRIDFEARAG